MSGDAPEVGALVDLVRDISSSGSAHPAFDGLRVFDHPGRLVQFLGGHGELVNPVTVELWPSLSCNARCPTCPYRLSGARDDADSRDDLLLLDLGLARLIAKELAEAGVRSVILTGGGEPLLHPGLLDIVDAIVQAGMSWALFTNGLLLTEELAFELLRRKPAFLRVSLDAGTPERYSEIYSLPEESFHTILRNIRGAARVASGARLKGFGLGFSLEPRTAQDELRHIANSLDALLTGGSPGIGLVAFRPRLIHYRRGVPLCPQPGGPAFVPLAASLREIVIDPLQARYTGTRFDLKEGLFVLASGTRALTGCLSSGWMTNLDHQGVGFATAELAGFSPGGQAWGQLRDRGDFERLWRGPQRLALHRNLVSGAIPVPLVHRTSPIDQILKMMMQRLGGPMDMTTAQAVVATVRTALTGLTNSEFV